MNTYIRKGGENCHTQQTLSGYRTSMFPQNSSERVLKKIFIFLSQLHNFERFCIFMCCTPQIACNTTHVCGTGAAS